MPNKLTEIEREYNKALRNLKRRVKTKEKAGYIVPNTIIPNKPKKITEKSIENLNKRTGEYIAKRSVYISPEGTKIKGETRLKQERSERSKRSAETRKRYFEAQEQEAKEQASKEQEAKEQASKEQASTKLSKTTQLPKPSNEPDSEMRKSFETFVDMFESWTPDVRWSKELTTYKTRDRNRGLGIIDGAIEKLGKEQVAQNLHDYAIRLQELAGKILYESGNKYVEDVRNGEINNSLNELYALLNGQSITIKESLELTDMAERNEHYE